MALGDRIKEIRMSLGWTQEQLANEAQISKSFLSEVENNKSNVSGEKLLRIAEALHASLDYLMKGAQVSVSNYATEKSIEIPAELSEFAEEYGLSFSHTRTLFSTHKSLLARRSSKDETPMTKEEWKRLYESLRPYME